MKSQSVIIVNSPYQALCALEAINFYNIEKYIFIACISGDPRDNQLLFFLNKKKIPYCIFDFRNKINVVELIKTIFACANKRYNNAIICDCANLWNKIVALYYLKPNSFVTFSDDGNNTMTYLQGKGTKNRTFKIIIQNALLKLSTKINKIHFTNTFFTLYADVALPHFNCYQNTFKLLSTHIGELLFHNYVYIVGTNINLYCKKLHISLSEYTVCLTNLFRYIQNIHKDQVIIYIPHGRDTLPLAEQLCQSFHFKFVRIDMTIELYVLDQNKYPQAIYGFTSTSLLNFKKLFPDTKVYNICCHLLNPNPYKEEYESFSSYFTMHGIERIDQSELGYEKV